MLIEEVLQSIEKQMSLTTKLIESQAVSLSTIDANLSLLFENQKDVAQHLANLEHRYAQLECIKPKRTPSQEFKVVHGDKK